MLTLKVLSARPAWNVCSASECSLWGSTRRKSRVKNQAPEEYRGSI